MIAVDANVLARYLLNDDFEQAKASPACGRLTSTFSGRIDAIQAQPFVIDSPSGSVIGCPNKVGTPEAFHSRGMKLLAPTKAATKRFAGRLYTVQGAPTC